MLSFRLFKKINRLFYINIYIILNISDNYSYKFATEMFRLIAIFICSSTYETHLCRKPEVKQEAGLEASLSTLMLRNL
jgi:hypothetical protein